MQYGDGRVETACVRFSEPAIDGLELLERSGLPVVVQAVGAGAAVCKLGPEGCDYPAEGCFCRREGARSVYWAFYTREGDAWAYASLGAASTAVRDGDLHGWAWGLGESGTGAMPPQLDLAAVCGPAEAVAPTTDPAQPAPASSQPARTVPAETRPALAATSAPAPTPTAQPAPPREASPPWSYLAFGVIVALLGLGAALLARRR